MSSVFLLDRSHDVLEMRASFVSVVAALAVGAIAAPAPYAHVVHEKRGHSQQWNKAERVLGDVKLPMRIGLTQKNLDEGHDILMDISNPKSKNYGKYYTTEEIHDMFAPAQDAVDAVRGWLEAAGIEAHRVSQSVNKQWIQFDAKTAEVEELLKAKFHFYEHAPTGKNSIACDEYSVPEHVRHHIDYITPGIKLYATGSSRPAEGEIQKRMFGVGSGKKPTPPLLGELPALIVQLLDGLLGTPPLDHICDVAIIPECISTIYNISQATTAYPGNELGIFEDLGDVYSQTDLDEFFLALAPQIPVGTHPTLDAIDGAQAPNSVLQAGPESDLDFQISYPIIYPQNSILFQTDDPVYEANYTYEGFLNNFLDALDGSYCTSGGSTPLDPPYPDPSNAAGAYKGQLQCGKYKPTNVISISYGGQEADLPASYQKRQCQEFMKLGMQGISIVVSSGDSGVAGPANDTNADGCLGTGQIFSPDFPSTCPYLTTAGATYLPPGASAVSDDEVAVTRFPSGGGFSNIYAIPDYQKAAVETYLTQYTPPYKSYSSSNNDSFGAGGGIYNRNGRGYPDISAIGDNVVIFNAGAPTIIGGTSASAPVFAAILTRINEERLAKGKTTIGFVNPTLYAHPEVLHDIVTGSNPGCGTQGFSCAPGWDPVTGLGTPKYDKMLALFMSLP
ncbi:subtilisin-like protein [Acrodontium crateriforme]|uniref:tripeptidyl-peptidase II n=1 Tax=Acrodontium crateriforme TaxID=150365 RepID=A0AAQ3R4W3_9PEZI|nr:subtilisin-like protein [Acrodontium crateriforme]